MIWRQVPRESSDGGRDGGGGGARGARGAGGRPAAGRAAASCTQTGALQPGLTTAGAWGRSWTRLRAPQGQNRFAAFLHSISRMMLFYMVFRFFFGTPAPLPDSTSSDPGCDGARGLLLRRWGRAVAGQSGTQQAAVAPPGAAGPASQFKGICRNIFPDRTVLVRLGPHEAPGQSPH